MIMDILLRYSKLIELFNHLNYKVNYIGKYNATYNIYNNSLSQTAYFIGSLYTVHCTMSSTMYIVQHDCLIQIIS